jgi:hypothetical protein
MVITVDGESHHVVTSARDVASTAHLPQETPYDQMIYGFAVAHAACIRLDVPGIPHDLDKFIDLLDNIEDQNPEVANEMPNPTGAEPSGMPQPN